MMWRCSTHPQPPTTEPSTAGYSAGRGHTSLLAQIPRPAPPEVDSILATHEQNDVAQAQLLRCTRSLSLDISLLIRGARTDVKVAPSHLVVSRSSSCRK